MVFELGPLRQSLSKAGYAFIENQSAYIAAVIPLDDPKAYKVDFVDIELSDTILLLNEFLDLNIEKKDEAIKFSNKYGLPGDQPRFSHSVSYRVPITSQKERLSNFDPHELSTIILHSNFDVAKLEFLRFLNNGYYRFSELSIFGDNGSIILNALTMQAHFYAYLVTRYVKGFNFRKCVKCNQYFEYKVGDGRSEKKIQCSGRCRVRSHRGTHPVDFRV